MAYPVPMDVPRLFEGNRLYGRWLRESMHIIGFGEMWRPDLASHPEFFYLTRDLVPNVVHAAGAIEYTVEKIDAAFANEMAYLEAFAPHALAERDDGIETGLSGRNRDVLHYEYGNLLFWLKGLKDRVETKDDGPTGCPVGLLPALAPGEKWTVLIQQAFSRCVNEIHPERYLANYVAHRGTAPHAFAGQRIVAGRVEMPIPDVPSSKIREAHTLTYKEGRELSQFAHKAVNDVDEFITAMLEALVDAEQIILSRRA